MTSGVNFCPMCGTPEIVVTFVEVSCATPSCINFDPRVYARWLEKWLGSQWADYSFEVKAHRKQ